jgi:hypothetical protein
METLHEPWNHSTEGDSPLSYNGIRGVKGVCKVVM